MEEKVKLRREARRRRDLLPEPYRVQASAQILRKLCRLPEYPAVSRIFLFSGFGSEPPTAAWAERFRADDKHTYYPKVVSDGNMKFYEVSSESELVPGAYGILEPGEGLREVAPEPGDWVLTPGVLFDTRGYRIGYGGGYYDRYMKNCPSAVYIGVAYQTQCVENLPEGVYDLPVSQVVTDGNGEDTE